MMEEEKNRIKLGGFLSRSADYSLLDKKAAERNLHLGIDYGTSSSKLVLTDYNAVGGEQSFVVRPSGEHGGDGGYRIPSTVAVRGNEIQFGFRAEALSSGADVYRSLKMLCAYPDRYYGDDIPLPTELDARDLATLYVGHLVQLGEEAARKYASRRGAEPRISLTMGAPMAFLDNPDLSKLFVDIVREAHRLRNVNLLDWISISQAISALKQAREEVAKSAPAEPRSWVRSEAEAALFWAHRSPEIDQGRYACVDIGAGTTSASWFHINATLREDVLLKERLTFYGAACNPPACDAIDAALQLHKHDDSQNEPIRGRESQILETLSTDEMSSVNEVFDQIGSVFRAASQQAFRKEKSLIRWLQCNARIFFLGGGSKIDAVRRKLIEIKHEWLRSHPEANPGVPTDLKEEDDSELRADPTFLLVAYGLARRLGDVPDVLSPDKLDDFKPTYPVRTPIDSEALYSD